ncbi:exodeoxyribonuclease VII small subunit [Candidatus Saccharibacteria bacterium]|nr:exodeoxyribonuclease VII small subunit [Candidatus Saccharibacteria bacterium]MBQ3271161.1 exodeoxyribonuclease VII small subunit [Candidatus Saccharibacteria bacterium]MBR0415938.1 exodeoxyribonuclease VII small subunit [Candidatus Saccharibacteria bacterium]
MAKTTISEKIKKLDAATDWFYSEDFKLDEATEKYKAAMDLAREIEKDLTELKNKIEVLEEDFTKEV